MIEKTGFEYGFGKTIEPMNIQIFKDYGCRTLGLTNFAYKETLFGKKEFRMMYYDYDGKLLTEREWDMILDAFTNDCLLYDSGNGLHFVSLCENLKGNTETKAYELSQELGQDYYEKRYRNDLTLRTGSKRYITHKKPKNKSWIYRKKPKFIKVLKYPIKNTKVSYNHLMVYAGLGLPKEVIRMYLTNCKVCKWKLKLVCYRCKIK